MIASKKSVFHVNGSQVESQEVWIHIAIGYLQSQGKQKQLLNWLKHSPKHISEVFQG